MQGASKEEQGRMGPILLLGLTDKINIFYHFTIGDIPSRVYKNSQCRSIGLTILPEDSVILTTTPESESSNDEESEVASTTRNADICSSREDANLLEDNVWDSTVLPDVSAQMTTTIN